MKKLPLTVIILTDRSDERFAKAVASSQFAHEVLIISNRIDQDLQQLHPSYSFKVEEWPEVITDFSHVRNAALKLASQDWVLFLDSDEEVADHSVSEIEKFITEGAVDGVAVRRSDIFHGKQLEYGEAGSQLLLRLGKKNSLKFTGAVHEVATVSGQTVPSLIEIYHHSHPSIHEFIAKIAVYSKQVAENRQQISFLQLLLELLLFPPGKFVYALFIQGGIIDGWHGVVYAVCMSLHSLLVRVYLYEKLFIKK